MEVLLSDFRSIQKETFFQRYFCKHFRAVTDQKACEVKMANYEDNCTFDNFTSAFGLLNVSIQEATNNKKLLASRLDRAISLKREVELKEKAAEEAKEEAAKSSLDILAKVEALKQARKLLKKKNDKYAREVYAQKAVLAKDLKELQLRMSGVLNKGRTSLGVSDEMRRALRTRLTKAARKKESADKEKIEKKKLALEALAFEESQMLKLKEESKRLKQEAMKNSELKDCLKEHESLVNIVFEDVSDKCQDIDLFIERLDQPVLQPRDLSSSSQASADSDLVEQKGNMNGSYKVKGAPVVAAITEVRHSVSTNSSVAYAERADAPVKHGVKKWKPKKNRS